jgi:hypothetical protein
MYAATLDSTFGFIVARAARYPRVTRESQKRTIIRRSPCKEAEADPALGWLLLNTQMTNRFLKGTVCEPAREQATNRLLKGTA